MSKIELLRVIKKLAQNEVKKEAHLPINKTSKFVNDVLKLTKGVNCTQNQRGRI